MRKIFDGLVKADPEDKAALEAAASAISSS
jgi:hypothetical protein